MESSRPGKTPPGQGASADLYPPGVTPPAAKPSPTKQPQRKRATQPKSPPAQPVAAPVNPVANPPRPTPAQQIKRRRAAIPTGGAIHAAPPEHPTSARDLAARLSSAQRVSGGVPQVRDQVEDEEDGVDAARVVQGAPPFVVSMVVHAVLLIFLAMLMIPPPPQPPVVEISFSKDLPKPEKKDPGPREIKIKSPDAPPEVKKDEVLALPNTPLPLPIVNDPKTSPKVKKDDPDAPETVKSGRAPLGKLLDGRQPGSRGGMLAKYGGDGISESAVGRGLDWLAHHQQEDGSWSLMGPYPNGAHEENRPAATGMALLAFLGAGHTDREGFRRNVVKRGADALLSYQNRDGSFFRFRNLPYRHALYTQAIATLAVAELSAMTRDERYADATRRAVEYNLSVQSGNGGWRYKPGSGMADTSVTGWFVMALKSAEAAGVKVPADRYKRVDYFLSLVATDDGTRYKYFPEEGAEPTASMTAEALLMRQLLGWERNDPRLIDGVNYLQAESMEWKKEGGILGNNIYHWYYATQVMHHMGGDYWPVWNQKMRQTLLPNQEMTKADKSTYGSWFVPYDKHVNKGGRLYSTCLAIYMLEVYYRHMPIYKGVYE